MSELCLAQIKKPCHIHSVTIATNAPKRTLSTSPFGKNDDAPVPAPESFAIGDRVTHDRCGLGRVVKVDSHFVTVEFSEGTCGRVPVGSRSLIKL